MQSDIREGKYLMILFLILKKVFSLCLYSYDCTTHIASTCVLHLRSYFEEPESLLAKSELICENQAKKRI